MSAHGSGSPAADLLTIVGLGFLVVALLRINGRKGFVVISTGTGMSILAIAAVVGHAG